MTTFSLNIPQENSGIPFLKNMRKDPLNFFVNLAERSGSHTWIRMPGESVLFLNDAKGIQHVLQKNHENYWKGKYNQVLKPIFGEGIFLAEGEEWKKQKKLSAPSFSGKNFPEMTERMVGSAQAMFDRLDIQANNNVQVDLFMELMWYTIDVVLRALYHSETENSAHNIKDSLAVILEEAEKRIWAFVSLPQNVVFSFPPYKTARNFLIDIVEDLIKAKQGSKNYPADLLGIFIDSYASDQKTMNVLHDQVMSFLLAGHETTANSLIWTFYELALRPDIQQRLRQEIDEIIGNEPITFEKIRYMKFARSVWNESMRLHPPVWSMSRASLKDDRIPLDSGDEVLLPAETTVMMCTYAMHKNTRYWKDPEAFDPDRFYSDEKHAPFSFFPFGGGPRGCLGQQFAEVESIIVMSMFLKRYNFTLVPGQRIEQVPAITLKPNGPVNFKLQVRDSKRPKVNFELPRAGSRCPVHQAA